MDETEITLHQHEKRSEKRAEHLAAKIDELKGETDMSTPVNVFTPAAEGAGMAAMLPAVMAAGMGRDGIGAGGAIGGGLGAGLVGGLLGGLLFGGNGGLLGRGNAGEGVVTPSQLTSAINGVTDNNNVTTILQSLGDIKAAVPLAEGQVQLAIAGAVGEVRSHIGAVENTLVNGQSMINKNISDAIASSLASQNNISQQIAAGNSMINLGIANLATSGLQNTYALNTAIRDDGDKTRALIVSQNDAMLNRQLAVAEAALLEQRAIGRSRETEVNVTQTVNQNQMQLQTQQQQQQQLILLSQIANGLANVTQIAHATNSNIIAGNSGAVATGPQSANPVNVNA